jgi:eukaryotic-like serine/threonine-protein kinase
MALSVQEFWQLVVASGLHDEENCRRLANAFANARDAGQVPRTVQLPEWMINTRAMTRYQAKVLLAGRPGPFVYGDYLVTDRLEGGGATGLFRAIHRPTGVNCSLYFLSEKAVIDPSVVTALTALVSTASAASLPTPYLTHCHTLVDLGSYKFLVIDELPAGTLAARLTGGKAMGAKEAARVLCQVVEGLAGLHAANQVHGAIRPDRVWLSPDSGARLANFPLARNPLNLVGAHVTWDVEPEAVDYCPPECTSGEMPTPRGDIYSLGCTLYHMLSGRVPFPGDDPQQTLQAQRSIMPPPLDQVNPAVPKAMAGWVARMMAKTPSVRYDDAGQLAAALAPLAKQFGMTAETSVAPPERVKLENYLIASGAMAAHADATSTAAAPIMFAPHDTASPTAAMIARHQRARRSKLPLILGGVAALAVIGGVATFLLSSGTGSQQTARSLPGPLPSSQPSLPASEIAPTDALAGDTAAADVSSGSNSAGSTPIAAEPTPSVDTVVGLEATMWASPTHGPRLNLAYVVPGAEIIVALRPAQWAANGEAEKLLDERTSGWLGKFVGEELVGLLDTPLVGIDRMIIAILDGADGSPRWALVATLKEPHDLNALLAKWDQPEAQEKEGVPFYQQGERAFYLPVAGEGRTIVIGPAELITEEVIPAGNDPPALTRELETLLAASDADRDLTILASPSILLTGSKAWLPGVSARLRLPLEQFLAGNGSATTAEPARPDSEAPAAAPRAIDVSSQGLPKAVLASAHLTESDMFVELRIYIEPNQPAQALARTYREHVARLPKQASDYIRTLALSDYSRDVLFGFPLMVEQFGRYTVVGTDNRQIVLRAYLPSMAAHNLALGMHLALLEQERPPASAEARPAAAKPATASNAAEIAEPLAERLNRKISLVFDRATLEKALQMVADELAAEVVIMGPDLQAEGITKNQSFGLEERDQPAREILQKIMIRANSDGKLVYVIKPPAGGDGEALYITTRAAAKGRGETLPAEFAEK